MSASIKRYWYHQTDDKWKRPGKQLGLNNKLYVGAFHSPETSSDWATLEGQIGKQLTMRRIYNPSAISGTWSQFDTATRGHWYSFKGDPSTMASGGFDAALTTWLNSVPSAHLLYLTWQHEPEMPSKGLDPASFRSGAQHFYTHVKSVRPQTIVAMPIFMDWTHNPASGRNPLDWYPGDGYTDVIGVDTYNTYLWPMVGSPTTWENIPITGRTNQMVGLKNFVNFATTHSKPWAIGEVASMEHAGDSAGIRATTSSYKAKWVKDLYDYSAGNGATAVLWFNIVKAGDTDPDMLITSSQGALTEEANAITAYGRSL